MKKFASVCVILIALLFIYAPIVLLFIYSFTTSKTIGVWQGFSFDLYLSLFEKEKLTEMMVNTFGLAIIAAFFSTIIGTIGAVGIYYNKKILGKLTSHASQIPVVNAEIVTALSLALVFSFVALGRTYISMVIGHVVFCTPFVVLSIIPKLKQMDSSLYEAALDLGASPMQAFFKVIVPEILPGIFAGFMLAITLSLDDYMITAYTKPPTFETISTYVYGALKKPKNSYLPELRALSSLIFIVMILVVVIMNFNSSNKKQKQKVKI